ncbi:MAG: hypothetical protein ACTHLR_03825 [Rhizomicrobium sp.]
MTERFSTTPGGQPQRTSSTDKSVDTRRSGFGDIKGGEAEKPGQSGHDEKQSPDKSSDDNTRHGQQASE